MTLKEATDRIKGDYMMIGWPRGRTDIDNDVRNAISYLRCELDYFYELTTPEISNLEKVKISAQRIRHLCFEMALQMEIDDRQYIDLNGQEIVKACECIMESH